MRYSPVPALLVAVLKVASASDFASDTITQESVQFDCLCEDLMSRVLQQGKVTFTESSAELGSNALGMLDEIVEIATDCPTLSITVTGHTDNTGDEAVNLALSQARAETVVAYLTDRGVEPSRLIARGAGSSKSIASNENASGRQVNRRIEFEVNR